jgi:hypothetical protein
MMARVARRLPGIRALPWTIVLEAGVVLRNHWQKLTPKERERVGYLIRKSKGRVANLSLRERAELKRIAGKIDLGALARDLVPFAGARRAKR